MWSEMRTCVEEGANVHARMSSYKVENKRVNMSRTRQNGRHFADDIHKIIFLYENRGTHFIEVCFHESN